jgi:hypothetical protein
LSQMRSMVFPLWSMSPLRGGTPCPGRVGPGQYWFLVSIEQCGGRWQAAAHCGGVLDGKSRLAGSRGAL